MAACASLYNVMRMVLGKTMQCFSSVLQQRDERDMWRDKVTMASESGPEMLFRHGNGP